MGRRGGKLIYVGVGGTTVWHRKMTRYALLGVHSAQRRGPDLVKDIRPVYKVQRRKQKSTFWPLLELSCPYAVRGGEPWLDLAVDRANTRHRYAS